MNKEYYLEIKMRVNNILRILSTYISILGSIILILYWNKIDIYQKLAWTIAILNRIIWNVFSYLL